MRKGLVFWFTGLSGSGKTTVANALKSLLESSGERVLILDGDDVRNRLHVQLGFTEADIKKNNKLIADLCLKSRIYYDITLVPIISPYRISRKEARLLLGSNFFEIYFSANLEAVMQRDVKGLYEMARQNKINNLIGFSPSNIYEPPESPDLAIDSSIESVEYSVNSLYNYILQKIQSYASNSVR